MQQNESNLLKLCPEQTVLRELLDYDAGRGVLIWRARNAAWFNARFAGRDAGCSNQNGYAILRIGPKNYQTHRIVWKWFYGEEPPEMIDHIDGNKKNNRIDNLRATNHFANAMNTKMHRRNKTGVTGLSRRGPNGPWRARVQCFGVSYRVGTFTSIEEAEAALGVFRRKLGFSDRHGSAA